MKKHLRILVYFHCQEEKSRLNQTTGRYHLVPVNVYAVNLDTTSLDHVDAHFLEKIVHSYVEVKDDIYNAPDYDGVWARGLREFMWRIGYEIEFVEVRREEGVKHHNEFTRNNPFGWLDFRAGYPKYEHREE